MIALEGIRLFPALEDNPLSVALEGIRGFDALEASPAFLHQKASSIHTEMT